MIDSGLDPGALGRFEARTIPEPMSGCLLWLGSESGRKYGAMWVRYGAERKKEMAHRIAHLLFKGPIPAGYDIDHLCKNTKCVNPHHLEAVTRQVNIARSNSGINHSSRTHCPSGHEYNEENTNRYQGRRYCRACRRGGRRRAGRTQCASTCRTAVRS